MDHFISLYIDNELSLDEKILFVEHCSGNRQYCKEAVSLLKQEKLLDAAINHQAPKIEMPLFTRQGKMRFLPIHSLGWAMAACLLLFFSFSLKYDVFPRPQGIAPQLTITQQLSKHRFVIQQHGSQQVDITGSFTEWQPVSLAPTGADGYWEVYLDLPEGEHRYSYIIDGTTYLPDPTVPNQELDDFGSTNSILKVKV